MTLYQSLSCGSSDIKSASEPDYPGSNPAQSARFNRIISEVSKLLTYIRLTVQIHFSMPKQEK